MKDNDRSLDDVFGALAHPRRRDILHVLAEHDTSLTLSDLTNEIARRERDTSVDERSEEMIESIHLNLYHRHVPKLAEAGLVEYDRGTNFVELDGSARSLVSDLPEETVGDGVRQC